MNGFGIAFITSNSLKSRNVIALVLFILALTIKLLIFFLATDPIIFGKYLYFATRLAQGFDIGERMVDLSPAYLYIHVVFYKVFGGDWEMLAVFQIIIGSLNCLFVYAIGEKLFHRGIGLLAAFLLLLYGNLTLFELTLEPETLVIFFNSLTVLFLIIAKNRSSSGHGIGLWFTAGLFLGLSVIAKPNALMILPGALIWIWCGNSTKSRKTIASLTVILGVILCIAPVTIRNYVHFDDLIIVTADGGKVFFHGNGPGATGMGRADLAHQGLIEEGEIEPDYAHVLFRNTARALSKRPLKPSECSRFWFDVTLNHMAENPAQALRLGLKKFLFFWGNYEVHDIDSTYKNYVTIQSWPLISFGLISAFGFLGMGIAIKKIRDLFLLYWMFLVYLASILVFFAASRYRLPVAPFLCLFAACALHKMILLVRDGHWKRFGVYLGIALTFYAGTNLPFRDEIKQFDQWQRATRIHYSLGGVMLFQKGQYREAIWEFQKTIEFRPGFVPAHNYLGKSYAILNDYNAAEESFQRVIRLAPQIDTGYLNMGILHELKGDLSKATFYLQKALSLNPGNAKAKKHLEAVISITEQREGQL